MNTKGKHRTDYAPGRARQDRDLSRDKGNVDRAWFQVPELRGFEKFVQGRLPEDMPQITSRDLRRLPHRASHGFHQGAGRPFTKSPRQRRPKSPGAVYSTFMAERPHACTSTFWAGPISWSAPPRRRPSATFSASSPRWESRPARRSSPCGASCGS